MVTAGSSSDIYRYLHTSFAWLLKATRDRLREVTRPLPPTEDERVGAEQDVAAGGAHEECKAHGHRQGPVFTSLQHMRRVLQPHAFRTVLWHLLLGNQVIWRSHHCDTASSALAVVSRLLPLGCCKLRRCSPEYVNSYAANLLGLRGDVTVPAHVTNSQLFVLIDVVAVADAPPLPAAGGHQVGFDDVEFRVTSGCQVPDKLPALLLKLDAALASASQLSDDVIRHCTTCYKEEWIK